MSFKGSDLFDPNFDVENVWPDLTNENLFDKKSAGLVGKVGIMKLSSRLFGWPHALYSPTRLTMRHSSQDLKIVTLSMKKTSQLHQPIRY